MEGEIWAQEYKMQKKHKQTNTQTNTHTPTNLVYPSYQILDSEATGSRLDV